MKRILSSINVKRSSPALEGSSSYPDDSPERIVLREVNAFCSEGNGPNQLQGTEYVHLPSIVESAESSATAAREAAHLLRKLLSNPSSTGGNIQYNAIMLVRILIDNPGHTFSRNLDAKFVSTVKELLREGRDMNVQRFLRETLDSLEIQRAWDEDLALLLQMWKKEKTKAQKLSRSSSWTVSRSNSRAQQGSNHFAHSIPSDSLPSPDELAGRISEAKMTAKLLMQFVQSTPPAEMLSNDLIPEFSGRCRRASRAIQNYINATNPPPDEDTLLTLIEVNDELSVALSKHSRAMLQARKAHGLDRQQQQQQAEQTSPVEPATTTTTQAPASADLTSLSGAIGSTPAPPLPQRSQTPPSPVSPIATRSATSRTYRSDVSSVSGSGTGNRYEYRSEEFQVQNPFADNYSITPSQPTIAENDSDGRTDERDRWNERHQQPVHQT